MGKREECNIVGAEDAIRPNNFSGKNGVLVLYERLKMGIKREARGE